MLMMNDAMREKLTSYALGDLTEAAAAEVRRMLDSSPDCRAELQEIELTLDVLRDALAVNTEAHQTLTDEQRAALHECIAAPKLRLLNWFGEGHPVLKKAAASLVLGSIVVIIVLSKTSFTRSSRSLVDVIAPRYDLSDENLKMRLPGAALVRTDSPQTTMLESEMLEELDEITESHLPAAKDASFTDQESKNDHFVNGGKRGLPGAQSFTYDAQDSRRGIEFGNRETAVIDDRIDVSDDAEIARVNLALYGSDGYDDGGQKGRERGEVAGEDAGYVSTFANNVPGLKSEPISGDGDESTPARTINWTSGSPDSVIDIEGDSGRDEWTRLSRASELKSQWLASGETREKGKEEWWDNRAGKDASDVALNGRVGYTVANGSGLLKGNDIKGESGLSVQGSASKQIAEDEQLKKEGERLPGRTGKPYNAGPAKLGELGVGMTVTDAPDEPRETVLLYETEDLKRHVMSTVSVAATVGGGFAASKRPVLVENDIPVPVAADGLRVEAQNKGFVTRKPKTRPAPIVSLSPTTPTAPKPGIDRYRRGPGNRGEDDREDAVPHLGDIPVVGTLFREVDGKGLKDLGAERSYKWKHGADHRTDGTESMLKSGKAQEVLALEDIHLERIEKEESEKPDVGSRQRPESDPKPEDEKLRQKNMKVAKVVNIVEVVDEETPSPATFKAHGVNPFYAAAERPFSTFSIDVDTASYTVARRYMFGGFLPPAESVRTEEFVNFFEYDYAPPRGKTFAVYADVAPSKFGSDLHLLKLGVKGKRLGREQQRAAVLTFVIDASGSMNTPDRLGLVKKSLRLLISRLAPEDRIAIVQYDSHARLVLDHTPVSEKKTILAVIDRLQTSGSTNLDAGLKLGYEVAARSFRSKAENRVLLLSDGVANLGTVEADAILASVGAYRAQGIKCSVFGFGIGTYDDAKLEQLADQGDGAYAFIDSIDEAKRVFMDDLAATLNTIASDVKIQIEFDPKRVQRYRQLGYENRQLTKAQFRDDNVDAGEVGSGQAVTALYEFALKGDSNIPLGVAHVRYLDVDTGRVEELALPILANNIPDQFSKAPTRFRLAAAAAEFAEILRGSPHAAGSDAADVAAVLRTVQAELQLDKQVEELLHLVHSASGMPRANP
ncbi:MAG: Ca-activated chloride channel family protein [Kiritimatiellia bacterium]|jgi:Ca-activated chloride channel family protein